MSSHAHLPAIMASLPLETRCPTYPLRHYCGFWLPDLLLEGIAAAHASFQPRPTDVLLAGLPKSGNTWLKALAFSALKRAAHRPSDADHPLRRRNPHDCVPFLDISRAARIDAGATANAAHAHVEELLYDTLPSPRLLATHTPYSLLPPGVADGRVVYVARDPKDVLVSFWLFHVKTTAAAAPHLPLPSFEETFELFCEGRCVAGPHWRHAAEFWEASRRTPSKVLFLRYEEMLRDPAGSLRELAAFMGCAFSPEEEEAGVVREIVDLCSLEKLSGLDVNRNGSSVMGFKNETFFRKGVAGDWSNYMTPEMAARLDEVVADALQGSGLTFGDSSVCGRVDEAFQANQR